MLMRSACGTKTFPCWSLRTHRGYVLLLLARATFSSLKLEMLNVFRSSPSSTRWGGKNASDKPLKPPGICRRVERWLVMLRITHEMEVVSFLSCGLTCQRLVVHQNSSFFFYSVVCVELPDMCFAWTFKLVIKEILLKHFIHHVSSKVIH